MAWLDLLAVQGPLKSLLQHHSSKASILRHSVYTKPFPLFEHSQQGHALRILCPKRGDIWGPLAYLSKQLNLVTLEWPPCLQALAATTLLIPEAQKLTRNAPLNVCFKCIPSKIYSLIRLSFPCPLLDYKSSIHTSFTHPFLLCLVNLLILLAYSLHQIQKQNTYLMTVFRP